MSLVLNGMATRLFRDDATGQWKAENDSSGWKVERILGLANNAREGEAFKVTTPDGTQHWFGSRSQASSGGVLNVEVFGNDSGEPCYVPAGFHYSHCTMPYRWNLDRVVDVHGNTIDYNWHRIHGTYGGNNGADIFAYDVFGTLSTIEYGASQAAATPHTAKVEFTRAYRCFAAPIDCEQVHSSYMWPDTPWDLHCALGATSCVNHSPAFFDIYRLERVKTFVRDSMTGAWQTAPITTIETSQAFPATGDHIPWPAGDDTAPSLWLASLTNLAYSDSIEFEGVNLFNRVNPSVGLSFDTHYRISKIITESGESINVSYSARDCSPTDLPTVQDSNSRRCYPQYWFGRLYWWHKYVVTDVWTHDSLGQGPDERWHYEYLNPYPTTGALWKYDQSWHTPPAQRGWSRWAGYVEVRTTHGAFDGTGPQEYTEDVYFRGMDGDKTIAGGWNSRRVVIDDHWDHAIVDVEGLAGQLRRRMTFHGPRAADGQNWHQAQRYQHVATQTGSFYMPANPTVVSSRVREVQAITQTKLAGPTYRLSLVETAYESTYGLPTRITDRGDSDPAISADDRCTSVYYTAPNTAAWIIGLPKQIMMDRCSGIPAGGNTLGGSRIFYDDLGHGATPVKGAVTRTEVLKIVQVRPQPVSYFWAQTSRTSYDVRGRVVDAYDALDRKTSTAYTPSIGGPTTQIAETGPMGAGWTTTVTLHTHWGLPTKVVDINGVTTRAGYDNVGRLASVWLNNRPINQIPDLQYNYQVSRPANWISTRNLGPDGQQIVSYQIFDSRLRPRQTQQVSGTGSGRLINDTHYNGIGATAKSFTYHTTGNPGDANAAIVTADEMDIKVQDRYTYDSLGRPTAIQEWTGTGNATDPILMLWQTIRTYDGDKTVLTTPPQGGTATTTISNVHGQTVELRQHHSDTPTGAYDTTAYTYDRLGQLTELKDTQNNIWTYKYNLLGQMYESVDPDAGTSTFTYDNAGQLLSSMDSLGQYLYFEYDPLGRRSSVRANAPTEPNLSTWLYDTVKKGQLTSTTRHVGGLSYTSAVNFYDDAYRPLSTTETIPGFGAGGSTLTYAVGYTYKPNGALASTELPGVGGLPAETLTYSYHSTNGLPDRLTTSNTQGIYVDGTTYKYDGLLNATNLGAPGKRVKQFHEADASTRRHIGISLYTENPAVLGDFGTSKRDSVYSYGQAGNIMAVASTTNGVAEQEECFRYDHLRRLTEAWTQTSGACTTPQREGAVEPYWRKWTFDTTGNRLTQTDKNAGNGDTVWTNHMGGTDTCGNTLKPHQLRQVDATGPQAGTPTRTFCYNAVGNTTKRTTDTGAVQSLTWDKEGHLRTLTETGITTTYIYDVNGRRLVAAKPGKETLYLPDGTELEKINGADPLGDRYYNGTAVRDAAGMRWTLSNHQGSTTHQVDPDTLAITDRRFMPYGEARGMQPAWLGTEGYVGGAQDDTGLIHLGAREYDPTTGRFVSVDPILDVRDPQQWHGYLYANNSPLTFSDPTGLDWFDDLKRWTEQTFKDYDGDGRWTFGDAVASHCSWGIGSTFCTSGLAGDVGDVIGAASGIDDAVGCTVYGDAAACAMTILSAALPGVAGITIKSVAKLMKVVAKLVKVGKAAKASKAASAGNKIPGKTPKACYTNSFDENTPVLLADGTRKKIKDIVVGDVVVSTDPATGQTAGQSVTRLHLNLDTELTQITVTDGEGKTSTIETTWHHQIWSNTRDEWVDSAELLSGEQLRSHDGSTVSVVEVRNSVGSKSLLVKGSGVGGD